MKKLSVKIGLALLLCSCMCLLSCGHDAEEKQKETSLSRPGKIAPEGLEPFEAKCAACHGNDGAAGLMGAANLQTTALDSAGIIQAVTNGKRSMPAFGKVLSPDEIIKVTVYLKTLHK